MEYSSLYCFRCPIIRTIQQKHPLLVRVIMVRLSNDKSVYLPGLQIENKVDQEIRDIHDSTGFRSQPPFIVDHTDVKVRVTLPHELILCHGVIRRKWANIIKNYAVQLLAVSSPVDKRGTDLDIPRQGLKSLRFGSRIAAIRAFFVDNLGSRPGLVHKMLLASTPARA
jgi:hypothetical protein